MRGAAGYIGLQGVCSMGWLAGLPECREMQWRAVCIVLHKRRKHRAVA